MISDEQFQKMMEQNDMDFCNDLFTIKRKQKHHTYVPYKYIEQFHDISTRYYGTPMYQLPNLIKELRDLWDILKINLLTDSFPIFPIGYRQFNIIIRANGKTDTDHDCSKNDIENCECFINENFYM